MALELASPLLPGAFLPLACLGSVARAVTGVAGGATRMALTQHFAQRQNGADIAAKEGSQARSRDLPCPVLPCHLCRAHMASVRPAARQADPLQAIQDGGQVSVQHGGEGVDAARLKANAVCVRT